MFDQNQLKWVLIGQNYELYRMVQSDTNYWVNNLVIFFKYKLL